MARSPAQTRGRPAPEQAESRARSRPTVRARDLGIDLESGAEGERFKWFLACLLFGKPIQQEVAKRAYLEFAREGLITPEALIEAGWDRLVSVLDRGHYVRFDFSTATKLLDISQSLISRYGSLANLFRQSSNRKDLARRFQEFKGIGPVTTRIFLRGIKFSSITSFRPKLAECRKTQ
ncbi:MAG: DNA methylase [candidate division NC10 bacterium]|nr:DNA methylase [candidate division NC10 bacterium]MDE2320709.1 DNA methylase [candidate division NC10 bacterium]